MNKPKLINVSQYTLPTIKWQQLLQWAIDHWFEITLGLIFLHLLLAKDVKVSMQFKSKEVATAPIYQPVVQKPVLSTPSPKPLFEAKASKPKALTSSDKVHKAQSFYNLTFILSPDYAERKNIPSHIIKEKETILQNYLKKYGPIAGEEQEKYGIPISITLAQGLLESNAGDSRLAKESNNHFGIKCRSKCKGCTCRNYHDDDIYDMFRVFKSPKDSYREHSILLNSARYKHLKALGNDYKKWAHGLKKAGYATDKKYAEKLIKIIEGLKLYQY